MRRLPSAELGLWAVMIACSHTSRSRQLDDHWCGTERAMANYTLRLAEACKTGDFYACETMTSRCARGAEYCDPQRATPSESELRLADCAELELRDAVLCADPMIADVLARDARLGPLYADECAAGNAQACYEAGLLLEHAGHESDAASAYGLSCTRGEQAACMRKRELDANTTPPLAAVSQPMAVSPPPSIATSTVSRPPSGAYSAAAFARCFGRTTLTHGCVSIRWTVAPDGTTGTPAIQGVDDTEAARCITGIVERLHFAPTRDERTLKQTLNCSP